MLVALAVGEVARGGIRPGRALCSARVAVTVAVSSDDEAVTVVDLVVLVPFFKLSAIAVTSIAVPPRKSSLENKSSSNTENPTCTPIRVR